MLLWKNLRLNRRDSICIFCRSLRSSAVRNLCNNVSINATSAPLNVDSEAFFVEPTDPRNIVKSEEKISVLEELPVLKDLSHVGPPLDNKSFNFAAFANESVVMQKLIDLGVDFYYIEKRNKILPSYLLQLDFDKHINPYINFLVNLGIPAKHLGSFFSKNPFFFNNNLDDLNVRINYLQSKKFTDSMIRSIVSKNPRWLNYSTVSVDNKLGFFQREFYLHGWEVRNLAADYPLLISWARKDLAEKIFNLKEVVGFSETECKQILLKQPYCLTLDRHDLKSRLDFMIVDMKLPLSLIAAEPSGLVNRLRRMKERHLFLKSLNKAQYDPKKPNYVSIKDITHGNDSTFCQNISKTSIETYNLFLKTL